MLAPSARLQADYIVCNANVYTGDPERPRATCFAVAGDRFVSVGGSEVLGMYPEAHRVNVDGLTIVPGFIDAHVHLLEGGRSLMQVDLSGARSVDEVLNRLRSAALDLSSGAWLIGHGWDQNLWNPPVFPGRFDLDRDFPDQPVWLHRIDKHAGWANSKVIRILEAHGHSLTEPEPEGGKVVRDEQGNPTGVFLDTAMKMVDDLVPPPTEAQDEEALRRVLKETARWGITAVHEAGVGLDTIEKYKKAIDEDWFDLRVYAMIDGCSDTFDYFCRKGPLVGYGGRLTVRSVKFFMDGALGSRGAALIDDYSDDPGNRGMLRRNVQAFARDVERVMEAGFQVNTHAIGDRCNRVVLDVYEDALRKTGVAGGRHRIEHAQVLCPSDVRRFVHSGIIASMQPIHAVSDSAWVEDRLGPERLRYAYAWATLLKSGAVLAFGSDFPIEPLDPLAGFRAATTHRFYSKRGEKVFIIDQTIDRAAALRAYTLDAAYAAFQENELGSITPGKYADFIMLSDDLIAAPEEELGNIRVLSTYSGGKCLYTAS